MDKQKNDKKINFLFVCTGNTCRSPMAKFLFNKKISNLNKIDFYFADSCGLSASTGEPINDMAVFALENTKLFSDDEIQNEIKTHKAKCINIELIKTCDIIITMTKEQKRVLTSIIENMQIKEKHVKIISENGIADPFLGSLEDYKSSVTQLNSAIDTLINDLIQEKKEIEFS